MARRAGKQVVGPRSEGHLLYSVNEDRRRQLGEIFLRIRKGRGLSFQAMNRKTGIPEATYRAIEEADSEISVQSLLSLCAYPGIPNPETGEMFSGVELLYWLHDFNKSSFPNLGVMHSNQRPVPPSAWYEGLYLYEPIAQAAQEFGRLCLLAVTYWDGIASGFTTQEEVAEKCVGFSKSNFSFLVQKNGSGHITFSPKLLLSLVDGIRPTDPRTGTFFTLQGAIEMLYSINAAMVAFEPESYPPTQLLTGCAPIYGLEAQARQLWGNSKPSVPVLNGRTGKAVSTFTDSSLSAGTVVIVPPVTVPDSSVQESAPVAQSVAVAVVERPSTTTVATDMKEAQLFSQVVEEVAAAAGWSKDSIPEMLSTHCCIPKALAVQLMGRKKPLTLAMAKTLMSSTEAENPIMFTYLLSQQTNGKMKMKEVFEGLFGEQEDFEYDFEGV